jgi:hypothetical protein
VRAVLGLSIDHGALRAVAVKGNAILWAAEAPLADMSDLATAIAHLAAERPRSISKLCVALSGTVAQVRHVDSLPPLSALELKEHVRLAPKSFFLQNGIHLITDACVTSRTSQRTGAIVAAAQETLLDDIVAGAAAAGLELAAVSPAVLWLENALSRALALSEALPDEGVHFVGACAAAAGKPPAISLLPAAFSVSMRQRQLRSVRVWAATCAAMWMLAFCMHVFSVIRARNLAVRDLALLSQSVQRADSVRRELGRVRQAVSFLEARKVSQSGVARLLGGIARSLPNESFLTSFSIVGPDRVIVAGFAPRAASAAASLERIPGVRRAVLDGAVTREVVGSHELDRFTATLSLASAEGHHD